MRVVDDDGERLPLVDRLESTRDAFHARDPRCDRVLVDVEEQTGSDGTEDVLDVERPAKARLDVDPGSVEAAAARIQDETLRANLGRRLQPERDERRTVLVFADPPRAGVPTRLRRSRRRVAAVAP